MVEEELMVKGRTKEQVYILYGRQPHSMSAAPRSLLVADAKSLGYGNIHGWLITRPIQSVLSRPGCNVFATF